MDDNGYDISDYQDVDPLFGTLADLDALIAGCHDRGIRLVMDLVVNHTSDEHPWFVESRDPASPKRDWYWWRPGRPTPPAERRTTGSRPSAAPPGTYDERSGEWYLHVFSPKQPDLNWENPEVRAGRPRDDALVGRPRRRRLPHGRDQPDLQGHRRSPTARCSARTATWRRRWASLNGPRLQEFLAEMNREVGLTEQHLLTVGEMPGSTVALAREVTDPARRELDMVFTFEHVALDEVPGAGKWALQDVPLPVLKANLATWQEGLAEVGWNSLYWDNHDQPRAVSRFGDDCPEHRVASAKTLATVLHLHRGTPYVYQGEELGMTNAGFTRIEQYADLESLNHYAAALGRGVPAEEVLRVAGGQEPRQRTDPDALGRQRARRLHDGYAVAPGEPEPRRRQRRGRGRRPGLGLPPLPAADRAAAPRRGRGRRPLRAAAARPPAGLGVHPHPGRRGAAGARELLLRAGHRRPGAVPALAGSEVLLATHGASYDLTLRPWESRVHRL